MKKVIDKPNRVGYCDLVNKTTNNQPTKNMSNTQNAKKYATTIQREASRLAAQFGWNCNAALDLSVALLTEVNWHSLASRLELEAEKLLDAEEQTEADIQDAYNSLTNK